MQPTNHKLLRIGIFYDGDYGLAPVVPDTGYAQVNAWSIGRS
jgi:hypothetical protein